MTVLIVNPLLQLGSLGIAKRRTRVRQSILLRSDNDQELSWDSTQVTESHGRLSLGVSEQRVAVTGSCLLINPNSVMPSIVFNLLLSPSS